MGAWDDFYWLTTALEGGALVVEIPDGVLDFDAEVRLARGELEPPRTPLPAEQVGGRRRADLISASSGVLHCVSDRVRDALRERGFAGWQAIPLAIASRKGETIDGYSALAVTGRCGPIDPELSEQIVLPPPVPGGAEMPGRRGVLFDPATWDGSDVFVPEGTTMVMVTGRVRDALEALDASNVDLPPIATIEQMA